MFLIIGALYTLLALFITCVLCSVLPTEYKNEYIRSRFFLFVHLEMRDPVILSITAVTVNVTRYLSAMAILSSDRVQSLPGYQLPQQPSKLWYVEMRTGGQPFLIIPG